MARKRSIGAVALIESSDADKKAVVQVRHHTDSFPGCAQLTFHGRVEEGENLRNALQRVSRRELAELFERVELPVPTELENFVDLPPEPLHVEGRASTQKEQIASLSLTIRDPKIRTLIQPLIDAGVVRLVSQNDLSQIVTIDPKNPDHKQNGIGEGLIGMFADERLVLERVLSDRS